MPPVYKAPKWRACHICAVAKAKCEPGIDHTRCNRCTTQNLACIPRPIEPRKRKRQDTSIESGRPRIPAPTINISTSSESCRLFEIERGMHYYRSSLFPFFPYVIMPEVKLSAAEFARTKPLLALVVAMLGCTKDRARQRELVMHARSHIGIYMVQRGQKTLDLLQGLLVLTYWSQLQLDLRKQRSMFTHMAMSLVVDLHLNRSPFARRHFVTATEETDGFELRTEYHAEHIAQQHTLEERRAFLGCIYMSSVLSNTSVNLSPIKFNDYAEQCCEILEKSGIHTDRTLASLSRLQHSVEQFRVVNCWFNMTQRQRGNGYEFIYNIFRQTSSSEDILQHVRSWDAKISAQWNAIPEKVKTRLLTIQYGYARVTLHECCLEESLFPTPSARHSVLQNCISAIRFLNDALVPISLEPRTLLDVPAHIFAQSNHNTFLALLLCSVKCGENSTAVVERQLGLREYFKETAERLEGLLEQEREEEVPAFYRKLVPMARGVQKWFSARLRNEEEGGEGVVPGVETGAGTGTNEMGGALGAELDAGFWGQYLNVDGDDWLQDMLSMDRVGESIL